MPSTNTIFVNHQPNPFPKDFQFFECSEESCRHPVVQNDPTGWEDIRKMFATTENPFYFAHVHLRLSFDSVHATGYEQDILDEIGKLNTAIKTAAWDAEVIHRLLDAYWGDAVDASAHNPHLFPDMDEVKKHLDRLHTRAWFIVWMAETYQPIVEWGLYNTMSGNAIVQLKKFVEEVDLEDGYMGIMSGRITLNNPRREDQ